MKREFVVRPRCSVNATKEISNVNSEILDRYIKYLATGVKDVQAVDVDGKLFLFPKEIDRIKSMTKSFQNSNDDVVVDLESYSDGSTWIKTLRYRNELKDR